MPKWRSGLVIYIYWFGNCEKSWLTYKSESYQHLVLVTQSCLTLCDPMDCDLPSSSVHEISQARILEWVAIPSPGDLPNPGIQPTSLALQADSLQLLNGM